MGKIDFNCDLGEGGAHDATLMPLISSANIACGYHAGDPQSIWTAITLARDHGKTIGAHVSFLDRTHFGRKEMDVEPGEVYEWVEQQLVLFKEIADALEMEVHHVKPHGALYNQAARDIGIAQAIATAVRDFDPRLLIYGLSGSLLVKEARLIGLQTIHEVFADRRYQDDGSLRPRHEPGALIHEPGKALEQVLQMLEKNRVTSFSGKEIPVTAETLCIHGDGENAVELAQFIHEGLIRAGFEVTAPARRM